MAKRRGVNVSAAIKEYLTNNSGVGPTEAAKAIGVVIGKKVSPTYVSNIKATMGKGKKKVGRKAGKKSTPATNGTIDLDALMTMKQLLVKVGADTARKIIDVLA